MSRQKVINSAAPFQPINAAAFMTGLSRWYLMEGCKAGTIPHIRVGSDYRINMPLLLDQLQAASGGMRALNKSADVCAFEKKFPNVGEFEGGVTMTAYEKETILNFNEEEQAASVFTYNTALQHRLEKLATEHPEECRIDPDYMPGSAAAYLVPKKWIRISPPRKLNRTEEQIAAATQRLKLARLATSQL